MSPVYVIMFIDYNTTVIKSYVYNLKYEIKYNIVTSI